MLTSLVTERLELRRLTSAHASAVLQFYKDNQAYLDPYEFTRPENFYTTAYQTAILNWEAEEMKAKRTLRYYIFLKDHPDQIIGTINFSNIQFGRTYSASIGYKIDHNYWNQGYAYEACDMCLQQIFMDSAYHLHKVSAQIVPGNKRSIALIQKLGFSYEGIEYKAAHINGAWTDLCRFGKLNPDF